MMTPLEGILVIVMCAVVTFGVSRLTNRLLAPRSAAPLVALVAGALAGVSFIFWNLS